MPIPAVVLAGLKSAAINKGLDAVNAPQGLRDVVGFATDPKGFVRNAIKNAAVENAPEDMRGAIEFAADPRGFVREAVKDAAMDAVRGGGSRKFEDEDMGVNFKKGGKVKTASSRADGCAKRGKTRGKIY